MEEYRCIHRPAQPPSGGSALPEQIVIPRSIAPDVHFSAVVNLVSIVPYIYWQVKDLTTIPCGLSRGTWAIDPHGSCLSSTFPRSSGLCGRSSLQYGACDRGSFDMTLYQWPRVASWAPTRDGCCGTLWPWPWYGPWVSKAFTITRRHFTAYCVPGST